MIGMAKDLALRKVVLEELVSGKSEVYGCSGVRLAV
jgi:hypothetical protein